VIGPFAFHTTPAVRFGPGVSSALADLAGPRLGPRVLVVTDAGVRGLGLAEPALAGLRATAELAVFDAVEADPSRATVMAAAAAGQGASGVVGFGGGSPMDVAKLAALLLGSGEDLDAAWGVGNARGPRLPLVLAPTTAGTGSEVTPVAIVTVGAGEKRGVSSPVLLPDLALLDPDLTLGLPPAITAATGVDAMVHAIEAYASRSPNANPVSRALAVEALRLLGGNVERAVRDGGDRAARASMLVGATLAGQAFANSPVAAVHALAYPIGGRHHVPHGLSNALVLPHVLRFNAPAAAAEYAALAPVALPGGGGDLADGLAALTARLGLPARLRDAGVPQADLAACAAEAMKQTRLLVNNPRPLTEADALAIYEAAW
jgi:alcohol dehydrogenase class IV